LCIGFALLAIISMAYASKAQKAGGRQPFARVREEWRTDMDELAAFEAGVNASANGSGMRGHGVGAGE